MMKSNITCLRAAACVVIAGLLGFEPGGYARAADLQSTHKFSIPAQPLDTALLAFSDQAKVQVLMQGGAKADARSPGAVGELMSLDALTAILRNTGFGYRQIDRETVAIVPAGCQLPKTSVNANADLRPLRAAQSGPSPQDSNQPSTSSSGNTPQGRDSQSVPNPNSDGSKDKSDSGIAEILVRGSRITNVDLVRTEDDVQPYYIFDSTAIEQSGATNVEDFLKQGLTMNTTSQSYSQRYEGQHGATSSINLRGLGSNETLVLVNGRRSAGVTFNGSGGQPDVNGIPIDAIERIEVLPSSSSAIYGGAAVGGVVNIILKKKYDGGEITYGYDRTTSGSSSIQRLSGLYGLTFEDGRTHLMVSGSYSDGTALLGRDRTNLVGRGIDTILRNDPSYLYSPSQPFFGATPNIASADGSNLVLKNGTALNSPITSIPAGAIPGGSLGAALLANAGRYNLTLSPGVGQYGLNNPIGMVPTNKALLTSIRREMAPWLDVFAEFSTSSNSTRTVYNEIADSTSLVPSTAPDSPFQQDVLITFPSNLSLPMTSDSVTQTGTAGMIVHLRKGWSSELDYTWSRNLFEDLYNANDSASLGAALASGAVNPFVDTIAHPLSLTSYVAPESFSSNSSLSDINWRTSGPLGTLPWGQPNLTVGLEHRKEIVGEGTYSIGYPSAPANDVLERFFPQSAATDSIYAEAHVPLVTAKNAVLLIHSLDVQLAGRSERYTVDNQTSFAYLTPASYLPGNPPQGVRSTTRYTSTNPTLGLKYQPIDDVTIRASFAKAFLPPTAGQLLPGAAYPYGLPIYDPKLGQTYTLPLEVSGGNAHLQPQTSQDWDFGIIFEPRETFLTGLRIDLEYYRIVQPNYIVPPTPQQIINNPVYADRVTRDPSTGRITSVDVSYLNAAEYKTAGWDLSLDYRLPTSIGTFSLHTAGTVVQQDLRQFTIGSAFLNYVGYQAEGGEAKYKGNAAVSWQQGPWTATWLVTYFGHYQQIFSSGSPLDIQYFNGAPYPYFTAPQGGNSIPSQTYHDLGVKYLIGAEMMGHGSAAARAALSNLSVQLGVKNVFNKLPPFDALYGPYYYSPYGDARLRTVRLTIKKSF